MLKGEPNQERKMSRYLGQRVALSSLVLGLILIALLFGFITPNSGPFG